MSPVSLRLRFGILACATAAVLGVAALVSCAPIKQAANITPVSSDPLRQAQLLAGLTAVTGPGVIVTLTDSKKHLPSGMLPPGMTPPNLVHDNDINQAVNELKAGGAEAIAINDQRLIATSSVRSTGATISVNGTPLTPPYRIAAIGDPKTLITLLNLPGGIADQLKFFDPAMFSIQSSRMLVLPAYSGASQLHYAKRVTAATMRPIWNKWADAELLKHLIAKRNQLTEQLRILNTQDDSITALRKVLLVQIHAGAKAIATSKPPTATDYRTKAIGKQIEEAQMDLTKKEFQMVPEHPAVIQERLRLQMLQKAYQDQLLLQKQQSERENRDYTRKSASLYNTLVTSEAKSIRRLQTIRAQKSKLRSAISFFNAQIAGKNAVAGER